MDQLTPGQRVGHAIREARTARGQSQPELGAEVARRVGRAEVFSQNMVSFWEHGQRVIPPPVLMAIEDALELRPGTLTRHYDYIRLGAEVRDFTVADAIARDVDLTPRQRKELTAAWEAMVERTTARRTGGTP